MWQSAARHCSRFGLIRCVAPLTGVLYLQQNTSSQTHTKTNKPVTRTAVVSSPVLVVFPSNVSADPLLPLLMMMFPFSPFGLVLHFARDSAVISSVSIPRIFGSVRARSLWSPHFKNPSSQVLITPPDVWWMLPLGAAPSLSRSLSLSLSLTNSPSLFLSLSFVFLLFEAQLLLSSRHKAMPHSLVLTHVSSSKSSPLPFHFPPFFFLPRSPSVLHLLCSFSLFMFCLRPCLRPSPKLSLPLHTCIRTARSHAHPRAPTVESIYLQQSWE